MFIVVYNELTIKFLPLKVRLFHFVFDCFLCSPFCPPYIQPIF